MSSFAGAPDSNSERTDAVKQLVNVYGGAMCDDDGPGARPPENALVMRKPVLMIATLTAQC